MEERPHSSDLELDQDLDFERRSWTIERIGWAVLAMIGVAALAGLLGPGPLSGTIAGAQGGSLWLEYSRFGRFRASWTLRVHVGPNPTQRGPLRVWISRNYLESVQIEQVTPQPEQVEAGPAQLTYVFAASATDRPVEIIFSLKAAQIGRQRGCVGLPHGPPLCFRQFIYP
jgi:hypothetical protein